MTSINFKQTESELKVMRITTLLNMRMAITLQQQTNFKTTYNIYKAIEKQVKGKQGKGVEYFLTKQNIKHLHNLALDYQFEDKQAIMNDIKTVDFGQSHI